MSDMMNIRDEEEKMLNATFNPDHPRFFADRIPEGWKLSKPTFFADGTRMPVGFYDTGYKQFDRGFDPNYRSRPITLRYIHYTRFQRFRFRLRRILAAIVTGSREMVRRA